MEKRLSGNVLIRLFQYLLDTVIFVASVASFVSSKVDLDPLMMSLNSFPMSSNEN